MKPLVALDTHESFSTVSFGNRPLASRDWENYISLQIRTFHLSPTQNILECDPTPSPWLAVWKHDSSVQICTFHAIPGNGLCKASKQGA